MLAGACRQAQDQSAGAAAVVEAACSAGEHLGPVLRSCQGRALPTAAPRARKPAWLPARASWTPCLRSRCVSQDQLHCRTRISGGMPALQMSRTKPRSHSLGSNRLDSTRAQHSTGSLEGAVVSRRTRVQVLTSAFASLQRLKTAAACASSSSSALARQQQGVKQSRNTCETSWWQQAPGVLVCSLVELLDVVSLSLLGVLQLDLRLLGQHLRQLEHLRGPCVRRLSGGACMRYADPARTLTLPKQRPSCLLSFSGRFLQASCRSTSAPAPYCSAVSKHTCQLRWT